MGMQNENIKNIDQARFLIFTFSITIMLLDVFLRSHSIPMFATHALRKCNSHVYIWCTYNTHIQTIFTIQVRSIARYEINDQAGFLIYKTVTSGYPVPRIDVTRCVHRVNAIQLNAVIGACRY